MLIIYNEQYIFINRSNFELYFFCSVQLSCCGIDSYTDWFETPYGNVSSQVPISCCYKSLNHTCVRKDLEKYNLPTDINKNVRI